MDIINTNIAKNPVNWIIVLLMLIIAGIFGHLVLSLLDQEPATENVKTGTLAGYTPGTTYGTN